MAINKRKISLKEAADISKYHPDYLSALIRKGVLSGEKIGRNWFTTEEDIYKYLSSQSFVPAKQLWSAARQHTVVLGLCGLLLLVAFGSIIYYLYDTTHSVQTYSVEQAPGLDDDSVVILPNI